MTSFNIYPSGETQLDINLYNNILSEKKCQDHLPLQAEESLMIIKTQLQLDSSVQWPSTIFTWLTSSLISTDKEFQKELFTQRAPVLMATLKLLMMSADTPRPSCSDKLERPHQFSSDSQLSEVKRVQLILPEIQEALQSSSTLKKVIGIWLEITHQFSSSETQLSSLISSTPKRETQEPTCHTELPLGTSGHWALKAPIKSPFLWVTEELLMDTDTWTDTHLILSGGLIRTEKPTGLNYTSRPNQELKISLGMKPPKNIPNLTMLLKIWLSIWTKVRLLNGTSTFKPFHKWTVSNTNGTSSTLPRSFLTETIHSSQLEL